MRAVIVDDMDLARANLKADLELHCPSIELVGEADGVVSAAKLLRNLETDILFLDIDMDDGTGFDLLEMIDHKKYHVIFTTASDQHAIRAFQFSAIDYLLKPIDGELLEKAVEKLSIHSNSNNSQLSLLKDSLQGKERPEKIALHTQEKMVIRPIKEVVRCEAMGNYTQFFFNDGEKLLVTKTLKEFDGFLSEYDFFRTHQSHLVNLDYVKAYIKTEGGYLLMNDGTHVSVSVRKKPVLVEALNEFLK